MQNNVKKRLSILCLCISFITMSIYLILIYQRQYSPGIFISIFYMLQFSISLLLGVYFLNSSEHNINKQRNLRYMWLALYLFYVVQMMYMLFYSSEFARDYVNLNDENYIEALQNQYNIGTNMIPFTTIKKMTAIFSIPSYANSIAIINLFGNFIAFMPNAFFFLILSKKAKQTWRFAFYMSVLIITVEVTQFLTLTGSMDIDDYILNFTGVMLAYIVLRIPLLQNMLRFLKGK